MEEDILVGVREGRRMVRASEVGVGMDCASKSWDSKPEWGWREQVGTVAMEGMEGIRHGLSPSFWFPGLYLPPCPIQGGSIQQHQPTGTQKGLLA